MKYQTTLPYQLNNQANDNKSKLWVIGIALFFIIGLFHSITTATFLAVIGGMLLLQLLDSADGEFHLSLYDKDSGAALFKSKKPKRIEEAFVVKAAFSWHYAFSPSGSDGFSAPSHMTYTELKLICLLKDGRTILFLERLKPWQEIPKGWTYEVYETADFKDIRAVKGLQKFRKRLIESI